jgi:hypothetical protein
MNQKLLKNTKIGRWYVAVVEDAEYTKDNMVKIYDTKHTSDFWKNDFNQDGYQPVASYYVSTLLDHNNELQMFTEIKDWTLTYTEVIYLQHFIYTESKLIAQ